MPKVTTCSAYEKTGIDAIWDIITEYFEWVKSNQYFEENRQKQNQFWMMETINEQLKSHFYNHPNVIQLLEENKKAVATNEVSPFAAAMKLLGQYFSKE
jgi:LAO/AO transport system kinase